MATTQQHHITDSPAAPKYSVWHDVKPFVRFGAKALGILAGATWALIKILPRPSEFKRN